MNTHQKKQTVIHLLSQYKGPVSLTKLLQQLGEGFAERTVRRWLSELVCDGSIKKIGLKKATQYYIDQNSTQASSYQNLSKKSSIILQKIHSACNQRTVFSYNPQWLESYIPNETFYLPLDSRLHLQQLGTRAHQHALAGEYGWYIFNQLMIDLSYYSSQLEGNHYSLLETKNLLLEGVIQQHQSDQDTVMLLNHKEAIFYLVEHACKNNLSEETMYTIHHTLSDGLLIPSYTGRLRNSAIRIQSTTYFPLADKTSLQIYMKMILEKAYLIHNPYEQSLFLLIHLSYLQGFYDFNQPTARLICNIPLLKANLVPLVFSDIDKSQYHLAMRVLYEFQEINPILDLFVFSYIRSCKLYVSNIETSTSNAIRLRYQALRKAVIRDIIVHNLSYEAMKLFITKKVKKYVTLEEQTFVYEDIIEDLKLLDISRLVGTGVTHEEFYRWKQQGYLHVV